MEDEEFRTAGIEGTVYIESPSESLVDPDLVFDLSRIHLEVSDYPVAKESDLGISDLTGKIRKLDDHAAAIGGFADVWRGHLNVNGDGEIVCSFVFIWRDPAKTC